MSGHATQPPSETRVRSLPPAPAGGAGRDGEESLLSAASARISSTLHVHIGNFMSPDATGFAYGGHKTMQAM